MFNERKLANIYSVRLASDVGGASSPYVCYSHEPYVVAERMRQAQLLAAAKDAHKDKQKAARAAQRAANREAKPKKERKEKKRG